LREGVSHDARIIHFIVFVAIPDILQISMWYYKSLCGRRQVTEPPKIMRVISFYFGSVLALFYHPTVD
jgi:hypothetical protein